MAYDLAHAEPEEPAGAYGHSLEPEEMPHSRRLLRTAAALCVMGVFAGGLWLAYTQGLRHAGGSAETGEVPLVRADTTPFKVKPENPGGMQIPDRDMLIYGQQRPQIEHLLPPPEQPMARPVPPPPPPPQQASRAPAPLPTPPQQEAMSPLRTAPLPAPQPATLTGSPPLPPVSAQPVVPQAASAAAKPPTAALPHPAPATGSPALAAKPQPVPDLIGEKIAQLEAAATVSHAKRADGAHTGGGLRLQLGALRTQGEARDAWDRLKRKNTDVLGNISAAAVRADIGGRGVFYRIETAPIADPATADRVCGELRERHLACMIVR
jgi:SPOR domain